MTKNDKNKILILGAKGMLGSDLCFVFKKDKPVCWDRNDLDITNAKDAALALRPLAGDFAQLLFAFGLFSASMLGAFILPVATSYALCEAFGWEYGFNTTWKHGRVFYSIILASIIIPALLVLLPKINLIKVMILSQDINGIILPIILIFVIKIINNKEIMGKHTNKPISNIIAWVTIVGIIIITALLLIFTFINKNPGI